MLFLFAILWTIVFLVVGVVLAYYVKREARRVIRSGARWEIGFLVAYGWLALGCLSTSIVAAWTLWHGGFR